MNLTSNRLGQLLIPLCLIFAFAGNASAALITSDFAFGSGTPFGGTTSLGGVEVTLSTTNTQPFGATSFRDLLNTDPAFVTFSFDKPIKEFFLSISFVLPPDEFLTDFNIGDPTSLTGDLVNLGGLITSSVPGDGGTGTLIWTGLNTTTVNFTIGNVLTSTQLFALGVDEFRIDAAPAVSVPAPPTYAILLAGLLFGYPTIRKRFSTMKLVKRSLKTT